MPKKIRIRTEVGVDKSVQVDLNQDFELLEILSLQFTQQELYTRMCSDYGVIVGRVTVNNGYGVPNAKVSIFIPLEQEDEGDFLISTLYPYKSLSDRNEDGYKYNLLPYIPSYSNHTPTGTFPTRRDVLVDRSVIEVYEKYYKFTVTTNRSGDFMIFGVPVGSHKLIMNVDISDIGEFSQTPQDLVRIGRASEAQVNGTKFKSSTNFEELPQIIVLEKEVQVYPLWGDQELCQNAISRADFDLTADADLTIKPTSVFIGSIFTTIDRHAIKRKCRVKTKMGNLCALQAGPGEILGIRQTIFYDNTGKPILELANDLEKKGKVIDENGAWLMELPMNLDYVTTNEFGEQIISVDPNVGIPTKGKYRFKIKWEQPQNLSDPVKRAYFLVPNIKEWGWKNSDSDPLNGGTGSFSQANASYAFSLDWNDYGNSDMITEAINCEDRFYEFQYNKVYTVSQLIDQYRGGLGGRRIISVKNMSEETCEQTNNPFPVNDAVYQPDILYILFSIFIVVIIIILLVLVFVAHVVAWILDFLYKICKKVGARRLARKLKEARDKQSMNLNLLLYPDCELCECSSGTEQTLIEDDESEIIDNQNTSILADTSDAQSYGNCLNAFGSLSEIGVPPPSIEQAETLFGNLMAGVNPYDPKVYETYCPTNLTNIVYNLPWGPLDEGGGYSTTYSVGDFSTNLTLSERLNLFNTKMKYFDNENFGYAPNQMKVTFDTVNNSTSANFHYDNVFVMLVDPNNDSTFVQGQLVTFQDPDNGNDINLYKGNRSDNPFGGTQITGTTINNPTGNTLPTINITYAHPIDPVSSQTVSYSIEQDPNDYPIYTFPADIEYFQVITAMTVNTYSGLCNPNHTTEFPQSLPSRFLFNTMSFRQILNTPYSVEAPSNVYQFRYIGPGAIQQYSLNDILSGTNISPLSCLSDSSGMTVVFLIRGVDPHSTRRPCSYDLNRLFGYTGYGSSTNLIFTGDYKLNIPIQPGYRIPRHSKMFLNSDLDNEYFTSGVGPQGIFFESYHFQPGNKYSAFTSNTISFYSSLDETSMGTAATGVPGQFYADPSSGLTPYYLINSDPGSVINGFNRSSTTGIRVPLSSSSVDNFFVRDFQTAIFRRNYSYGGSGISTKESPLLGVANYTSCVDNLNPNQPNTPPLIEWATSLAGNCLKASDVRMWCDYTFTAVTNNTPSNNRGYYVNESVEGGTLMTCVTSLGRRDNPIPIYMSNISTSYYLGASNSSSNTIDLSEYAQINNAISTYNAANNPNVPTSPKYNYYGPIRNMKYYYFSPGLDPWYFTTYSNPNKIVMRSDRLPTSDESFRDRSSNNASAPASNNFYAFQQNSGFAVYTIDDQGGIQDLGGVSNGGSGDLSDTEQSDSGIINSVLNSLNNCDQSYPLKCYTYNNITNTIAISSYCQAGRSKNYFSEGCYKLVREPYIKSFFKDQDGGNTPSDKKLILEWATRLKIIFALCRNVFGHMFTNNWINGTLFAYSFKNDRFFTSPTDNPPNSPYNKFCTDTIVLHNPTNTFYYRSAPFEYINGAPQNGIFIGLENERRTLFFLNRLSSNKRNLLNPTTILDLGSKNEFLQEIVLNDNYDGYFVDKLNPTSFGDVDDILNFFVISRLANDSFIGKLRAVIDQQSSGSILSYFTRVPRGVINIFNPNQKNMVDGDYAQMISINSEIGVAPFEPENYPDSPAPLQSAMFFNGGNAADGVMGIFFSSETQFRDYVSPRRKIVVPRAPIPPGPQDFYYIPVKTQFVPFYDWEKKVNPNSDSIFGSQRNDWGTDGIYTTGFFSEYYQSMDRIGNSLNSRLQSGNLTVSYFFMTKDTSNNEFFKGYLYGEKVDSSIPGNPNNYTENLSDVKLETGRPAGNNIRYRVGAPYHFYFGLVKGASAIDLFRSKYVEKDFTDE